MINVIKFFTITLQNSGIAIPSTTIVLDLNNSFGIFERGFFSGLGFLLWMFMMFLFLLWVCLAMYSGLKIIISKYEPQALQAGAAFVKNAWIGVTYAVTFFSLVGIGMVFLGLGVPWDWAENLAQCPGGSPAGRRFYFQGIPIRDPDTGDVSDYNPFHEQLNDYKDSHPATAEVPVYCCRTPEGDPAVVVGQQLGTCDEVEIRKTGIKSPGPACTIGGGGICIDSSGASLGCCVNGFTCSGIVSGPSDPARFCSP